MAKNLDSMSEEELHAFKEEKNAGVNALRKEQADKSAVLQALQASLSPEDKDTSEMISLKKEIVALTTKIKAARDEVLSIHAVFDAKREKRYEEERLIAEGLSGSSSVDISAEAADAVSEAEKITGG